VGRRSVHLLLCFAVFLVPLSLHQQYCSCSSPHPCSVEEQALPTLVCHHRIQLSPFPDYPSFC